MSRNIFVVAAVLVCIAQVAFGSALLLTCDTGGVALERYDDATHAWKPAGTLPRTFVVTQYEMVQVRVTAPGYKDYEAAIEVNAAGTLHTHVVLEPENPSPNSTPLFAIDGTTTRKNGLAILAGSFTVKTVNLTTYRTPAGAGQGGQDSNPVQDGGYFCNTLANLANNRAVAVGDKIYTGAYSNDLKRCLGYKVVILSEDDIVNGYVTMNIIIR